MSISPTLTVNLKNFSYPLYIGENLLTQKTLFNSHIVGKQVMIVTNTTVAKLYLHSLFEQLKNNYQCDYIILPDGEAYKNLETLNLIFDQLLLNKHYRTTTLIALGGGVIGDITGFAAACYQRGVAFLQIPTTLLAQVDSAIGGKTAVNHQYGKNMIGAFHQPNGVISDTQVLLTLSNREFNSGLAEIIKYGLLSNDDFFIWLELNLDALLARKADILKQAIHRSCQIKAAIVAEDEHDHGIRALLNLGHTFGHAIENALGYGTWLHGEAVAVGLVLAAKLSMSMGTLTQKEVTRIHELIKRAHLPSTIPSTISIEKLLKLMAIDKKIYNNRRRFIILIAIGHAQVTEQVTEEQLISLLRDTHTSW